MNKVRPTISGSLINHRAYLISNFNQRNVNTKYKHVEIQKFKAEVDWEGNWFM